MESRARLLERFILTSIASSFIIILLYTINGVMLISEILDFELVNLFVYIILILSGIVFSAGLDFFITPKSKGMVHAVFLISMIILMLILSFAFQQYDAPYALIPSMIGLYIICAYLNSLFLYHDVFLDSISGMHGEELRVYLFHNNLTAGDFGQFIKKLQGILFIMGFAVFVSVIGGKLSGLHYNPLIIGFILYFYTFLFISFILLGIYNREIYYAFLGIDNILPSRSNMFRHALIIMIASAILGLTVSTDKAIIKIKPIEEKQREEIKIENPQPDIPITDIRPLDFGDRLFEHEEREHLDLSFLWYILDKIAKAVMIIGAVLLLVYTTFRIISSGAVRAFFKDGVLFQFLSKLWEDLREFFKMLFHFNFEKKQAYATVQAKSFRNAIQDFLKNSKKNRAKRSEIDRLTKLFMTLIDWGSRRSIEYRTTMAPAEYTNKIKDYFDSHDRKSHTSFAVSAGDLFEKALYDKDTLSAEEEADFTKAVKSITSYTIS
ncbi:MAG: hypothetical protein IJ688_05060 [Treponema sp.]|nr:hypothetical protein [Treponema sp.]